jgi:hypothetical protein
MTAESKKIVGKIIRIEWNTEDNSVRVLMDIIDPAFKARILHSKDLQDIITVEGRDIVVVASNKKKE